MADTGIDPSVCYVEDRNSRTPYNSVSSTHRKLATYITFADRQENTEKQGTAHSIGHGTHVASTLVGRSIASTGSALYNGIAPNSKVGRRRDGWKGEGRNHVVIRHWAQPESTESCRISANYATY